MLASTLFSLPPLPYPENALEPVISANTLSFHHGKHHKTYIETLNKLIKGTDYESSSLESIITETAGKADKMQVFNNAAQSWNHTFFWNSLKRGGGKPTGIIAQKLDADFGGFQTKFGPDTFVVVEKWASAEALKAHAASPHMAAYGAKTRPMIANRVVHVLSPT